MSIKITSIGHECHDRHDSGACRHNCVCEIDGSTTNTLVSASDLVDYPELMDDTQLEHFSQYRASLKFMVKGKTYDLDLINELKRLYIGKCLFVRDTVYHECLKEIETVNIIERLKKSLNNGYGGFVIYTSQFLCTISEKQRDNITKLLYKKTTDQGLKKFINVVHTDNSIKIELNTNILQLNEGERGIVCESFH